MNILKYRNSRLKLFTVVLALGGCTAHCSDKNTELTVNNSGIIDQINLNDPSNLTKIIDVSKKGKFSFTGIYQQKTFSGSEKKAYVELATWNDLPPIAQAVRTIENTMISGELAGREVIEVDKLAADNYQKVVGLRPKQFASMVIQPKSLILSMDIYGTAANADYVTTNIEKHEQVDDPDDMWGTVTTTFNFKPGIPDGTAAVTLSMLRTNSADWMSGTTFDANMVTLKKCMAAIAQGVKFSAENGIPEIAAGDKATMLTTLVDHIKAHKGNLPSKDNSIASSFEAGTVDTRLDNMGKQLLNWLNNGADPDIFAGISAAYLGCRFLLKVTVDHSGYYCLPKTA